MVKFAGKLLFIFVIFLQLVTCMDSNKIGTEGNVLTTNQDPKGASDKKLQEGLILGSNDNVLSLGQKKKSPEQKLAEGTMFVLKFAILHPIAYLSTAMLDVYFIFKDQPVFATWVACQYSTMMIRYTLPNRCCCGFVKKINDWAELCGLPVPMREEKEVAEENKNSVDVPIKISEKTNQPLVKSRTTLDEENVTNENQIKESEGSCAQNVKILCGHLLMNRWSFMLSMFISWFFIYDDSIPLGILITMQILTYFLRINFKNMTFGKKLNKWAREVGVPDTKADPSDASQTTGTYAPMIPFGLPYHFATNSLNKK